MARGVCLSNLSISTPTNKAGHPGTRVDVSGCGSSCLFVAAKLKPVRVTRGEINPVRRGCVSKSHATEQLRDELVHL